VSVVQLLGNGIKVLESSVLKLSIFVM